MSFSGVRFAFPFGLWLGVFGAGVLAAYLYRRRAKRQVVPFLGLWEGLSGRAAGSSGARVRRVLDLLLSLLLCAGVALAAGGPYLQGTHTTARDLVLVLDGGIELRAGNREEEMARAASAEIERRAPGTRFVVLGVGDAGVATTTTDDPAAALAAVLRHGPGWTSDDPGPALAAARRAAASLKNPDLVWLTDRAIRPSGFRLHAIGKPVRDAGFRALSLQTDPEGKGSLAVVEIQGDGPVSVGKAFEGEIHGRKTLRIPVPRGAENHVLRLSAEGDGFPFDDVLYFRLHAPPPPRVLVVSRGAPSAFLVAALQSLAAVGAIDGAVDTVDPKRAAEAAPAYDVAIVEGCAPGAALTTVPGLYLAPPPSPALPFRVGEETTAPAILGSDPADPILAGVDLERTPPRRARPILGGRALVRSVAGPILSAGPGWIALGYAPEDSVLASSPSYPLLLRNAIAALVSGKRGTEEPEFFRMGEKRPVGGAAVAGDGAAAPRGDRLLGPPGFWKIGARTFAVDLFAAGLDLSGPHAPSDPLPAVGRAGEPDRPLEVPVLAVTLVLLLLGWWLALDRAPRRSPRS